MTLLLKTQKIPKILCVITKTARSLDALFAKRGRKICWENGLLLRSLSKTKVPFKGFFCPLHLHFPLEICCNAYVISSVKDQQKKGLDFCGQNYKLVFVLETRKLFLWFGSTLFSTWTSVHPGKGKCKKQRQKKAKFFIIKTGKLLFLTGNSTCQKMLTLCGDKRSFFLDFTWVHFRNADNFLERKKVRF